jgi:hypothetical protein
LSSSARITIELVATGDSEVQSALKATGNAADELGKAFDESSTSATKIAETFLGAAGGANAMAKEVFGLWTRFDDLEKVQLKVTSSALNVESAHTALIEKQQALNELVQKGVTYGLEYEIASRQIKEAEDELAIAKEKEEMAQGSLTEAYVNFGFSVIPAVQDVYAGFTEVKKAVTGDTWKYVSAIIQERFTTQAASAAHTGSIGAMMAHKAATMASTLATQGLAFATKLLNIAMGPVGWVILGIGTGLALFATNAFGVRDAVNSMGKAIGDAFPAMKPLLDGLAYIASTLFPDTSKESSAMSDQVSKDFTAMQDAAAHCAAEQAGSLTDMGVAYASTGNDVAASMKAMEDAVRKSAGSIKSQLDDLEDALGGVGISGSSIGRGIGDAFSASIPAPPAAIVPDATTPQSTAPAELTESEKLVARRRETDEKVNALKARIDALGGGLSFAQVEQAFQSGALQGGDVFRAFKELARLQAESSSLQKEIDDLRPRAPTWEELLKRGQTKQDLIQGGTLQNGRAVLLNNPTAFTRHEVNLKVDLLVGDDVLAQKMLKIGASSMSG